VGEKTYQVLIDGDQKGPFDESWICVRLTSGELSPKALVWSAGMADWVPAESLEQFQGLAPAPAAPPPPAAPAPIPPVSHPPAAVGDDDDRTVTVGQRPPSRPAALSAEQRPGRSVEPNRSVPANTSRHTDDTPDPKRKGWNRRERIVALALIGGMLLLSLVVIVPWFKKRVLGTCDDVYDDCVQRCEAMFDTYADMQKCVSPCQDERRRCVAKERPRVQVE
jgi:GYF domain 2